MFNKLTFDGKLLELVNESEKTQIPTSRIQVIAKGQPYLFRTGSLWAKPNTLFRLDSSDLTLPKIYVEDLTPGKEPLNLCGISITESYIKWASHNFNNNCGFMTDTNKLYFDELELDNVTVSMRFAQNVCQGFIPEHVTVTRKVRNSCVVLYIRHTYIKKEEPVLSAIL